MSYNVKYKLRGQWFFRKLKNVKGDGLVDHAHARFFILPDESRVEIPCDAEIIFDKQRFFHIKTQIEAQTGQNIPVNT